MLRRLALALALLAAPLSGCLDAPGSTGGPSADATYRVGGAFTENATQAEIDALRDELPEGSDLLVMESFPMQYAVTGLAQDKCDDVRALLQGKPFVASVGECRVETTSADPDEPVTDSPTQATWSVHGRFIENATGDDMRALEAELRALGATGMPILKSYPAQYVAHGFPTAAACESARDLLAQKAYVATVDACQAQEEEPATGDGETGGDQPITREVRGGFTEAATQRELDELQSEVEALGGMMLVLESFPMQYRVTNLDVDSCAEARRLLQDKAYVASVGECEILSLSGDDRGARDADP